MRRPPASSLEAVRARVLKVAELDGLPVEVRESRRARRLRLEARLGSIRVTFPLGCPPAEVQRFVEMNAPWIAEKTRAWQELAPPGEGPVDPPIPDPEPIPEPGAPRGRHILYRGRRTPFRTVAVPAARGRVRVVPSVGEREGVEEDAGVELVLELPARWAPEEREPRGRRVLARWYDAQLLGEAHAIVAEFGHPRGLVPREIRFSQPQTRWGSCARNGIVRLNRRLVGAPPEVFRYLVLHEIAHLRHRDHSPRFWGLVEAMDPEWRAHRRWLREHGVALG